MICISCQTEINPKWKAAIDKNECPFCGDVILDEKLKELLSTLHGLFDALQEYPAELDDWLLSNFQYIKTSSDKLINYVSPELLHKKPLTAVGKRTEIVKDEKGEQEVVIEKTQTPEETNIFFNRAFNKKEGANVADETLNRTSHFKEIAERIKKSGSTSIETDEDPSEEEEENEESFDDAYEELLKTQTQVAATIAGSPAAGNDRPSTAADFKVLQRMKAREEGVPTESGKGSFFRS